MFGDFQTKLIALILPLILAPLVTFATQGTKRYLAWVDGQPAFVKQIIAALYAAGFSALAGVAGTSICTDGSAVCDAAGLDWRVILTWGLSLAIHGWKRKG
jgi:hypothetical protein